MTGNGRRTDRFRELKMNKVITAKILDPTHLELSQAISVKTGELVQISILVENASDPIWEDAAKARFLDAYCDQDAIYDDL